MVLKMRGSAHNKSICSFNISDKGMQIGEPFTDMRNILGGSPIPQISTQ